MLGELPDEIKIVIILNLPSKTIRILSSSCKWLNKLIKNNDLIERRKFLGFPRATHCALYNLQFLATFSDKLNQYLISCPARLKYTADRCGSDEQDLYSHNENLVIILNEIVDDLSLIMIRGDIIYERNNRFIFDGEYVAKLDSFPKEFIINLGIVPINYWGINNRTGGIPGSVWLNINTVKEECIENVQLGDGLKFGNDKYIYYTEFTINDQVYYLGSTNYMSKEEFREIFEYNDKLMVFYHNNMLRL